MHMGFLYTKVYINTTAIKWGLILICKCGLRFLNFWDDNIALTPNNNTNHTMHLCLILLLVQNKICWGLNNFDLNRLLQRHKNY